MRVSELIRIATRFGFRNSRHDITQGDAVAETEQPLPSFLAGVVLWSDSGDDPST
jgi:hypothetical protein